MGSDQTAFASKVGLRKIARNMSIPFGTVLARSKREGSTQQIAKAKLIDRPVLESRSPDGINNATVYAEFYSRSYQAVIRVYDDAGNLIETQEHAGAFPQQGPGYCRAITKVDAGCGA